MEKIITSINQYNDNGEFEKFVIGADAKNVTFKEEKLDNVLNNILIPGDGIVNINGHLGLNASPLQIKTATGTTYTYNGLQNISIDLSKIATSESIEELTDKVNSNIASINDLTTTVNNKSQISLCKPANWNGSHWTGNLASATNGVSKGTGESVDTRKDSNHNTTYNNGWKKLMSLTIPAKEKWIIMYSVHFCNYCTYNRKSGQPDFNTLLTETTGGTYRAATFSEYDVGSTNPPGKVYLGQISGNRTFGKSFRSGYATVTKTFLWPYARSNGQWGNFNTAKTLHLYASHDASYPLGVEWDVMCLKVS